MTRSAGPIAFLVPGKGGGLDLTAFGAATVLAGRGHDVRLLLCRAEGVPTDAPPPPGLPVEFIGSDRVRDMVAWLRPWVRQHRPRVVHADDLNPAIAAAIAGWTTPARFQRVLWVHHQVAGRLTFSRDTPWTRVLSSVGRRAVRTCDTVVTVSDGLRHEVSGMSGRPVEDVHVLHSPSLAGVAAWTRGAAPHPWLEDPTTPTLVCLGRLAPVKDHPTLLRAVAGLRASGVPARLLVVGDGPEHRSLDELASTLGLADAVEFVGHREDALDWFAHADVAVLASTSEGLARVLVEALAVGVPVVATDAPHGTREVLGGGEFGDLVPVGDDEALAAALARRLSDPWVPDVSEHLASFTEDAFGTAYERHVGLVTVPHR